MLEKITIAGTASRSFAEASTLLEQLAELSVQAKQVERVTRRIGDERVEERDAEVAAFRALPLAEKFGVPVDVTPPELAVVMVDGGRLQIRDGSAPQLAQAAWAAGFQGASRKAFVGDGSANNWRLQRRYFGSFVPILDFIHALS